MFLFLLVGSSLCFDCGLQYVLVSNVCEQSQDIFTLCVQRAPGN